jgi:hypothetical protein
MVELGVNVNTQTAFIYFLGESFVDSIGLDRCRSCMPVRTLSEMGLNVGNSHDATVTQPLPGVGLYSAVTRKTLKGTQLGADEAVDPYTALSFYALPAARHSFMEDKIGSIEVGKYGDLAIWNFNPLDVSPEELKEWSCEMAFVEGKKVYNKIT